ncbi:MAG: hypothetical protein IH598_08275 [Bacteroidales bacterium]|nr:hypothetical protein [Bacteroidales bacterium]
MNPHFKLDDVNQVFEAFVEKAETSVIDYFLGKIVEHHRIGEEFTQIVQRFSDIIKRKSISAEDPEEIRNSEKELFGLLGKTRKSTEFEGFVAILDRIEVVAKEMAAELPETIFSPERIERYPITSKEKRWLRLKKRFSNIGISFRLVVIKAANHVRKLFNLTPVENRRIRKIPFRDMAIEFMVNHYTTGILEQYKSLMKIRSEHFIPMWQVSNKMDEIFLNLLQGGDGKTKIEELQTEFVKEPVEIQKQLLESFRENIHLLTVETFNQLEEAYLKVNKADLPAKMFKPEMIGKKKKKIGAVTSQTINQWKNAHFTLLEDWTVDVEMTLLYYSVFNEYAKLKIRIDEYITDQLTPSFKQIADFISQSSEIIRQSGTSLKKTRETISAERKRVADELVDTMLSQIIEKLTGCFSDDIEHFRVQTLSFAEHVSDKRAFVRNKTYDRPIRDSEISWISPRELLNFEALAHLSESLDVVESAVETNLDTARLNLLTLGTVFDFNLESALMLLDQKQGAPKDAIHVAQEGLDRAMSHLEMVRLKITASRNILSEDIKSAVNKFDSEIQKLKNTEKIFDLQLKIARIRAVEKSKQVRKETLRQIKQILPEIVRKTRNLESFIRLKVDEYSIRFGFITVKKFVTFELTEFISQTQEAVSKLPFVYQRIYALKPTDEERFFVNRNNELNQLTQALDNWNKERFINTAIIGEKGSGVTSLINYFLRGINNDIPVIQCNVSEKVYTPEKYLSFFSQLLGQPAFGSNQEVIEYFKKSGSVRIIVMENLQHFFLKRVGGFDCINMFFDLMTNTIRNVFWIGTFTGHTWNFLDKTIQISNFFTDEIFIEPMSKETIEEIIFKRNRLSGYQIFFEPNANNLQDKAFQKMDDDSKQLFLRRQYFAHLRRMSSGNISLAQLYWLRSTLSVTEQNISIEAITDKDFTFVKSLTDPDLFVLQTLLLHDGLTLEDFALVMNKNINVSRNLMIPMYEKGILIRPKSKFTINPLIYKPVTDYLASRNFIH